jgi:hypothetical protein
LPANTKIIPCAGTGTAVPAAPNILDIYSHPFYAVPAAHNHLSLLFFSTTVYTSRLFTTIDHFHIQWRPAMKKPVFFLISICMLPIAFLTFISCPGNGGEEGPFIIPMQLNYQHKDTAIPCDPCIADPLLNPDPHADNHAAGPDGTYGNTDDCPHCSAYCAPASIAMIAKAYGQTGAQTEQDSIYDKGKQLHMEIQDNGIIESHGVGMYHGAGATLPEVQDALDFALDNMTHNEYNASKSMTETILKNCIEDRRPVLWLDHNGWPKNQSDESPPPFEKSEQGHAKVIAGYDDRGTSDVSDDRCLIYDPWPEYNDKQDIGLLPTGAEKGPDDTFDPYWFPLSSITGDTNDVFLVPQNSIP